MRHTSIGIAWWWGLIIGVALGMSLLLVTISQGHDQVILQCAKNIAIDKIYFVKAVEMENGLLSETYSLEPDGPIYIEALSIRTHQIPDQDHETFPMFYLIDTDHDGYVDVTYQDLADPEDPLSVHCEKIVEIDSRTWLRQKEM